MKFDLINLPYKYDSLEPYIDAQTMEIHYSKHHQTYVNNLNKAVEGLDLPNNTSLENFLTNNTELPEELRSAVKNNAGGVFNHNFFWKILSKNTAFEECLLKERIVKKYSSVENFMEEFTKSALSRFGSGWAWLVLNDKKDLEILSTANQDSPVSLGLVPLLTADVWEHAYYLKYQNRRKDYIDNWWNVVNWKEVSNIFNQNI